MFVYILSEKKPKNTHQPQLNLNLSPTQSQQQVWRVNTEICDEKSKTSQFSRVKIIFHSELVYWLVVAIKNNENLVPLESISSRDSFERGFPSFLRPMPRRSGRGPSAEFGTRQNRLKIKFLHLNGQFISKECAQIDESDLN